MSFGEMTEEQRMAFKNQYDLGDAARDKPVKTEYLFTLYNKHGYLCWQFIKAVDDAKEYAEGLPDMANDANQYLPSHIESYFTDCRYCTLDKFLKCLRNRGEDYD